MASSLNRDGPHCKKRPTYVQPCQPRAHGHRPSNTRTALGQAGATPSTARPQLALPTTASTHTLPYPTLPYLKPKKYISAVSPWMNFNSNVNLTQWPLHKVSHTVSRNVPRISSRKNGAQAGNSVKGANNQVPLVDLVDRLQLPIP